MDNISFCEVIKNPLKWAGSQSSFCCCTAESRLSLLHFCPCLQRPLLQNKNCINELFSLRRNAFREGRVQRIPLNTMLCYFFPSSSWFYKTIGPRPEPLIPGSRRNIWLLHPHRIGRETARGKHAAQSSCFDCQMGRMAGLEWARGPALWILFIALPSNAKRNFECSSCIFNMKLVSQMFLQTFSAS